MNTYLTATILSLLVGLIIGLPTSSVSNDTALNCSLIQNVLSCQYLTDSVECDAISNLVNLTALPVQIFGLSVVSSIDVSSPELTKISLYPRVVDLPVYLSNSIFVNGVAVNLSLYYSLSDNGTGIRITDQECFSRFLNLINNVNELHTVSVQQNLLGDSQNVNLFGLLLISSPDSRNVRQFYGGGYGRRFGSGFGGGWGGYGRRFGNGFGGGWGGYGRRFGYGGGWGSRWY